MRTSAFKAWLADNYAPNSAATHYSCAKRVEDAFGDLDEQYDTDGLAEVIVGLTYSSADAAAGKPNPGKLEILGSLYDRLPGFKSAIRCYCRFRDQDATTATETAIEIAAATIADKKAGKTFELEAHLQAALRTEIVQLEPGLAIVDGGVERSVASGEIDILARDEAGALVVIELKRDLARRDTIGQILGYMGDLMMEEPGQPVRGIIVAGGFDRSCRGAVRAMPSLTLKRYRFDFAFETVADEASDGFLLVAEAAEAIVD